MLNTCYQQFVMLINRVDRTDSMIVMVVAVVLGTYFCRGLASKLQ